MVMTLSYQGSTETTIGVGFSNNQDVPNFDVQYATRPDFQFCIAPIFQIPKTGAQGFTGFNRAQTYWFRAREAYASGAKGTWSAPIGISTYQGDDTLPDYAIQVAPAVIVVPERPSRWYGSATQSGYAVENLGRPSPAAAYRCGFSTSAYLFAIETNGQPIDTIAVLETNIPEAASIRFFGSDTEAGLYGISPTILTPPMPFRASPNLSGRRGYHSVTRLAAPITSRFITVVIEGFRATGDIVHITHAVFGRSRVIKGYSDMTDQPFDLSTLERQRDGSPDAVAGFRGRKVDFEIAFMTERQHEAAFADLAGLVGSSDPVLVIPNSRPGAYLHDRILYGNLVNNRQTNSNARFTRSLSVESIINP